MLAGLYRIFFGSGIDVIHVAEIVFRTSFMYLYTVLNVRLMDRRSMGMLSPFEIIIIIALGSAVGDPMYDNQLPLLLGMVVITTMVFVERIINKITMKSVFLDRLVNGTPILLIKDGQMQTNEMKRQNFSKEEIHSILRLRGVKDISEVEVAYLEPSGSISLVKKQAGRDDDLIPANIRDH